MQLGVMGIASLNAILRRYFPEGRAELFFVGASLLANKRGAMRFASKLAPTRSLAGQHRAPCRSAPCARIAGRARSYRGVP